MNEEEEDVECLDGQEEEEQVSAEDRLETLKTLTGTVMAMIECSNRATKRPQSMIVRGSVGGRVYWPPEETTRKPTVTNNNKVLLNNNSNNSLANQGTEDENKIQKEEKDRLDKEFQDDNNYENYVNYFKSQGILFPRSMWTTTTAVVKNREGQEDVGCGDKEERKKLNINQRDNSQRMGLKLALNLEELVLRKPFQLDDQGRVVAVADEGQELGMDCEYDSEKGKFNCNDLKEGFEEVVVGGNDQNVIEESINVRKESNNFNPNNNINNVLGVDQKGSLLVNKKIEYFENKLKPSKEDNRLKEERAAGNVKKEEVGQEKDTGRILGEKDDLEKERKLINILCLGSFFMTVFLLYLFPLPN